MTDTPGTDAWFGRNNVNAMCVTESILNRGGSYFRPGRQDHHIQWLIPLSLTDLNIKTSILQSPGCPR
ncbi:MAG: hypothetical protein GX158_03845 [Bacteroidales bacterium]|nr:hypothetical protein [Bacteroidales bacterium]